MANDQSLEKDIIGLIASGVRCDWASKKYYSVRNKDGSNRA